MAKRNEDQELIELLEEMGHAVFWEALKEWRQGYETEHSNVRELSSLLRASENGSGNEDAVQDLSSKSIENFGRYVDLLGGVLRKLGRVEFLIRQRHPIFLGKLWQNHREYTSSMDRFVMAAAYREVLGGVLAAMPQKDRKRNKTRILKHTTIERDKKWLDEFERDHQGQNVSYFASLNDVARDTMSKALDRARAARESSDKQTDSRNRKQKT